MYFTPEEIFFYVLYDFYQVLIRDAPGISEKDENRSKSTKVIYKAVSVSGSESGNRALPGHSADCSTPLSSLAVPARAVNFFSFFKMGRRKCTNINSIIMQYCFEVYLDNQTNSYKQSEFRLRIYLQETQLH